MNASPKAPTAAEAPPRPSERGTTAVFVLGLVGNLGLAVVKLIVGHWAGARALMADGWHSLSDLVTNGGVWIAHRYAKSPPDEDHHYGHGNAEALAGLVVGVVLAVAGIGVIVEAVVSDAVFQAGRAAWAALGVAVLSIVVNVGLTWITLREGRRQRSHGLLALARDNASDVLAAWLVIVGIAGAWVGMPWVETTAAVLIGCLIIFMAWTSAREGLDVLMDRAPDPALREAVVELALANAGVRGVQSVRIHPLGASVRIDMEISVEAGASVAEGHRIAHAVERAVQRNHPDVREVHVHVNPWWPAEGGAHPG